MVFLIVVVVMMFLDMRLYWLCAIVIVDTVTGRHCWSKTVRFLVQIGVRMTVKNVGHKVIVGSRWPSTMSILCVILVPYGKRHAVKVLLTEHIGRCHIRNVPRREQRRLVNCRVSVGGRRFAFEAEMLVQLQLLLLLL